MGRSGPTGGSLAVPDRGNVTRNRETVVPNRGAVAHTVQATRTALTVTTVPPGDGSIGIQQPDGAVEEIISAQVPQIVGIGPQHIFPLRQAVVQRDGPGKNGPV